MIEETMSDLNNLKTAPGFDQVYYPGQRSQKKVENSNKIGIEMTDEIYEYLTSDVVHSDKYSKMTPFGN